VYVSKALFQMLPESVFSAVLAKKHVPWAKLLVRTHASVLDSPGSSSVWAAVDGPTTKVSVIVPTWVPIVDTPSNVIVRILVPATVVAVGLAATTETGSFAAKKPAVMVMFWLTVNGK
jgi:hypothetical protein